MGGGREETQAMAAAITPGISSNTHHTGREKQLYLRQPVVKKANEQQKQQHSRTLQQC